LGERVVVVRHALRNALIPIISVLGLDFGAYLTGSILTETIFSWPGIGRYVVNAIARRAPRRPPARPPPPRRARRVFARIPT
jgi:ABC-type dipeptide/oligopeptide/nickel transport system permease component